MRTQPAERLRAFMSAMGWTHEDAATRFRCHGSMVSLIVTERRSPGRRLAVKIERETRDWERGPIRVREWPPKAAKQ